MRVFARKQPRGEFEASTEQPAESEIAATDVDEVTTWVEQMAIGLSYDRVIWGKDAMPSPLSLANVTSKCVVPTPRQRDWGAGTESLPSDAGAPLASTVRGVIEAFRQ
jgi:hypothetical protein